MTPKHLIAYGIIALALVALVALVVRLRRRPAKHHGRINITRDGPGT